MKNVCNVRIRKLAIAAVLALTALPLMQATPVTWLVTGFTFTDGSTLAGGVTYNAATNTYSDDVILATGGAVYDNIYFQSWNPSLPISPSYVTLVQGLPMSDLTGIPSLWILLSTPINGPAGSIVTSPIAIEALCADATCSAIQDPTVAYALGGELVGFPATTPIPEPSTALLLPAAALMLVGWRGFRHGRARTRV